MERILAENASTSKYSKWGFYFRSGNCIIQLYRLLLLRSLDLERDLDREYDLAGLRRSRDLLRDRLRRLRRRSES